MPPHMPRTLAASLLSAALLAAATTTANAPSPTLTPEPRSAAEEAFARAISHLPPAEREHPGIPGRRFRFDFAWPKQRIAVEIHGGHWTGGRHTQGKGFASDCEKKRLAILQGWRVLEYTADEVRKPPEAAAADVKNLLAQLPHTG